MVGVYDHYSSTPNTHHPTPQFITTQHLTPNTQANMRILIMGAGKMGSFFIDLLSFDHEVAAYEKDARRLRFTYNCQRFTSLEEVKGFQPELVINAVTVKYTLSAFEEVLPVLPKDCILSDISSVKTGLKAWYDQCGHPYVSTHPMFGPTFAPYNRLH